MREAGSTHGSLPEELSIGTAAATRETLLGLLAATLDQPELRLDASGVAGVDAAGLQLLIALQAELAAGGRGLRLCSVSPALESALALTGMSQQLAGTAQAA